MITIKDRKDETISFSLAESTGQSVTAKNLVNCKLDITGHLGAFYLYDCQNSEVSIGYIKSAINLYNCSDVKLTTVCQQLRINECERCQFQVKCSTYPALVSSTDITFKELIVDSDVSEFPMLFSLSEKNPYHICSSNWPWENHQQRSVEERSRFFRFVRIILQL